MTATVALLAPPPLIDYGPDLEAAIGEVSALIQALPRLRGRYPTRWLAIKLLEEDSRIIGEVSAVAGSEAVLKAAAGQVGLLRDRYGEDVDTLIADHRYWWINAVVRRIAPPQQAQAETRSDRLDRILTHRWLGLPIFLLAMWLVFKLTTDVSAPYLDWIDGVLTGPVADAVAGLLALVGWGGTWIESLVVDGVVAGVGGVLVFIPVLLALYLALALLEDTGYMARAAFVMDRHMRMIGLHGKSFVPLVIGFGCNVPAIYATRTLENRRDRLFTGLLIPFMSCGARLPVYVLFGAVFFPRHASFVVFAMYLIGVAVAILIGLLLKRTLFRQHDETGLLMELPPYRMPTARAIWRQMWERTRDFLRGATTVILFASVFVWALTAIPVSADDVDAEAGIENSLFAAMAGAVSPIFAPLGFGSWQATSALASGFVAKEVVISTLSQTYGMDEAQDAGDAGGALAQAVGVISSFGEATLETIKAIAGIFGLHPSAEEVDATPGGLSGAIYAGFEQSSGGHAALAGLSFMVFVLLYTPCMVVVAAQRQEFGNRWMAVSVFGQLLLAWLAAFLIFQGGVVLGLA